MPWQGPEESLCMWLTERQGGTAGSAHSRVRARARSRVEGGQGGTHRHAHTARPALPSTRAQTDAHTRVHCIGVLISRMADWNTQRESIECVMATARRRRACGMAMGARGTLRAIISAFTHAPSLTQHFLRPASPRFRMHSAMHKEH